MIGELYHEFNQWNSPFMWGKGLLIYDIKEYTITNSLYNTENQTVTEYLFFWEEKRESKLKRVKKRRLIQWIKKEICGRNSPADHSITKFRK